MLKFSGIPYPLKKTSHGYFPKQGGTDQIISDVLQLLLTNPGERVMMPTFGTPLKQLLFEQNDALTVAQARQLISASLAQWEPRVEVTAINVLVGNDDDAKVSPDSDKVLSVQIQFVDPENIASVQNLVLQVPLAPSAASGQSL